MAKLDIERVTPESFHELIGLINELAEFEHLTPPDPDGVDRLRQHAFQKNPYYEAYLARHKGAAVGYLFIYLAYSSFNAAPTLFLEDIFVQESHRGKGFGKELFLFAVRKADELGCRRMEWSALNWNKRAIDFYLSMGAEPLDQWTFYRMSKETIGSLARKD